MVDEKILIPYLGESIDKALVVKFHKFENDEVTMGDIVAEIETDKITLEIPSPFTGVLKKNLISKNEYVKTGDVLCIISSKNSINSQTIDNLGSVKQEKNDNETIKPFTKKPLSILRQTISHKLQQATSVTLTTFNEINMEVVLNFRKEKQKVSILCFFIKAVVEALKKYEVFRSYIEGDFIITKHDFDIGIAVSTENGLIVPIIKDANKKGLYDIDDSIKSLSKKAHDSKLNFNDIEGGAFTITNGGVFGSLLSTPLLNPPQSGILGLHAINDRPIASNGNVVIAKMMYVALSYDHRIVDGKEAVGFLKDIKDFVENFSL